jgi:hypothetical protein
MQISILLQCGMPKSPLGSWGSRKVLQMKKERVNLSHTLEHYDDPEYTGDDMSLQQYLAIHEPDVIVEHLYMKNLCKLTFLPEACLVLTHLTHLAIQYTNIVSLPESIGTLPHLGYVFLSNNAKFHTMPRSLVKCKKLAYLTVEGSPMLERIPPVYAQMNALNYAYFVRNHPEFPEALCGIAYNPSFYSSPSARKLCDWKAIVARLFTYRAARETTSALLALSRRHCRGGLHKDVARSMLAPMLYETRAESEWIQ